MKFSGAYTYGLCFIESVFLTCRVTASGCDRTVAGVWTTTESERGTFFAHQAQKGEKCVANQVRQVSKSFATF
ncbi:MAG: hypothetical protein LH614_08380 [Pyrinomonadaceae bacterium]|nr:hypothetical protein [Pyrinomonadaceae bacterium]